jgi:hypothetical protein
MAMLDVEIFAGYRSAMQIRDWRGSRSAKALFWTALAFAFVMAVLPQPPEVPGEPNDKVQHIAAFATLPLLSAYAYPRIGLLRLLAGLSMFGVLIELVQAVPALHRDSEALDWVADTIAAGVVLSILRLWRSRR